IVEDRGRPRTYGVVRCPWTEVGYLAVSSRPGEHAATDDIFASRQETLVSKPSTYACLQYPAHCGTGQTPPSSHSVFLATNVQRELKRCARAVVWGCPELAAVRLYDRTAGCQPHTHPFRFCRKESLEEMI